MGTTIKKNNRILLLIKLPPPLTGATLMNSYVAQSELLSSNLTLKTQHLHYAINIKNIGKFSFLKIFKIFKNIFLLINNIICFKPNIIYFQISPLNKGFLRDLIYVTVIKLFNKKVLFHLHGKGIQAVAEKNKFFRRLYIYTFKNQYAITLSKLISKDIASFPLKNIYILPNGIPDHNIKAVKKTVSSPLKILFLSNLFYSKGIVDFIKAVAMLKAKHNIQAHIVGDEADISSETLHEMIKEYQIEDITIYHGPLYKDDKFNLLKNVDLMIYPSKRDAFPLTIIEAMMFNIPVIGTFEGAIPEMIDDGETGFVVDKNAPEQIAAKIKQLINEPARIQKMGFAGRKKYEKKYILPIFEENMKNVFNTVLNNLEV